MNTKENHTRAKQVRILLADGKTPQQIAEALGCKPLVVYQIQYYDRQKAKRLAAAAKAAKAAATPKKRKPGRPKGTKNKATVQLELDNYALRSRLDEAESKRRHAEATEHAELKELRNEVMRYRSMGFIERLGFLFRGV